jgi:hypothetical protein
MGGKEEVTADYTDWRGFKEKREWKEKRKEFLSTNPAGAERKGTNKKVIHRFHGLAQIFKRGERSLSTNGHEFTQIGH